MSRLSIPTISPSSYDLIPNTWPQSEEHAQFLRDLWLTGIWVLTASWIPRAWAASSSMGIRGVARIDPCWVKPSVGRNSSGLCRAHAYIHSTPAHYWYPFSIRGMHMDEIELEDSHTHRLWGFLLRLGAHCDPLQVHFRIRMTSCLGCKALDAQIYKNMRDQIFVPVNVYFPMLHWPGCTLPTPGSWNTWCHL